MRDVIAVAHHKLQRVLSRRKLKLRFSLRLAEMLVIIVGWKRIFSLISGGQIGVDQNMT